MRIALAVLAAVAAGCGGGKGPEPDVVGTLIVEPPPGADSDAYIATEAEVLRSQTVRTALKEQRRLELGADALVVTPKPGTHVIEVGVRDPDKQRAAQLCNALMQTYVDSRLSLAVQDLVVRQQALAAELDQHPGDPKLVERMRELELTRQEHRSNVRLLDPCTPTASRR